MKINSSINGKISIVLIPENDMEKMILEEIAKNPVEIFFHKKVQVIDKEYMDSVVISNIKQ